MATYYAGIGGNDGNAGTSWALRKLTIQAAVNVATTAGDTIYVGPGTYRETVTMNSSGSAGNVISLIGDYTGALTSGVKGVVRITGSADDIALTRANCIVVSSKNYITIRGFQLSLTSNTVIALTAVTYVTIDKCHVIADGGSKSGINASGASGHITVTNCYFRGGNFGCLFGSTVVDNSGNVVQNCVFEGTAGASPSGVSVQGVGGVTVNNCAFIGLNQIGVYALSLTAGQFVTVNNCIFYGCAYSLYTATLGFIVEDYNTIWSSGGTARTNVTAGANSVTRPPLFDTRWFFEMVNGGRMVTPFDLASYSTLVEYNSGTGAPSTDIRGASVVGTYREWGSAEYDATLKIAAGGGLLRGPGMGGGIDA